MNSKILLPILTAVAFAGASYTADAGQGRNGAAALGLAAGVAVGAVGATILSNPARAAAPAPAPGYYPVAQYETVPACVIRPVELFDRNGTFVKTERMRVCR
jgi:hypothetical protein